MNSALRLRGACFLADKAFTEKDGNGYLSKISSNGRIVFQRLNDKWRVHSYNLSGDSRVIASSDDEKAAPPKPGGPRKKR